MSKNLQDWREILKRWERDLEADRHLLQIAEQSLALAKDKLAATRACVESIRATVKALEAEEALEPEESFETIRLRKNDAAYYKAINEQHNGEDAAYERLGDAS